MPPNNGPPISTALPKDSRGPKNAGFAEVKAEIKAQNSRIDVLQRVIWPLIGLLAMTVFGLLYKAVIG